MVGRLEGKVVVVTGAAGALGKSHAVKVASEGADVVAIDVCAQIGSVPYGMPDRRKLEATADEVRRLGRRVVAEVADVRSLQQLETAIERARAEFGQVDHVVANAGISTTFGPLIEMSEATWQDTVDVNLTGVWKTCRAAIPHIKTAGRGGSVVIVGSAAGIKGTPNYGHYSAAKHGLLGLMKTLALELGADSIRVNAVIPGSVNTPMIHNDAMRRAIFPDRTDVTDEEFEQAFRSSKLLPIPWVECEDVSEAVLFLLSDQSRYMTGTTVTVDAGMLQK